MWRIAILMYLGLRCFGLVELWRVHRLPRAVEDVLRRPEHVEIFSLGGLGEHDGPFLGADSLGSVVIQSSRVRKRLMNRILLGNRYNIGGLMCLGAEYGVRVRAGEISLDLTFCFDCSQMWVAGPTGYAGGGTIAGYPVSLLNKILTQAGIPLPPPRKH